MKRFAVRFAVVAALGAAMIIFASGSTPLAANNADDPAVKEIMQKANGKDGICKGIGSGLKLKEPKWDDLNAKAKELVPLAKAMGKNKPPKGDEESWKKFTSAYAKAAEDLETATDKKDAAGAAAAMKVLTACTGCHAAHRPKK
jgi:hypothetical protein